MLGRCCLQILLHYYAMPKHFSTFDIFQVGTQQYARFQLKAETKIEIAFHQRHFCTRLRFYESNFAYSNIKDKFVMKIYAGEEFRNYTQITLTSNTDLYTSIRVQEIENLTL